TAALTAAKDRVARLHLFAATKGTILDFSAHEGESIPAGARLGHIADLETLTISAPVNAAIAHRINVGRHVGVHLPTDPPSVLQATVSAVALVPDSAEGAYTIRVKIPNPAPGQVMVGLDASLEIDHLDGP